MDQDTPPPSFASIGHYRVEKKIASGGMGEIYAVYDPLCDRRIALKKIRSDRLKYPTLKERFLREAKIASQMTHPSIIPIYSIHHEDQDIYYTMPYVEGKTLKQILIEALEEEKRGMSEPCPSSSIPSLLRIFLSICQGIAYCHTRGVLHRDIKPENIIIGKYGETLILDWGLADFIAAPLADLQEKIPGIELIHLTRPGKIPGTLSYIAPERIMGKGSSYASDIYALGVILYQILTLKLPFRRTATQKLKKQIEREELIDPLERAPFRDIPIELALIAKRCLESNPALRYPRVEEIIAEIESFLEGRGQWHLIPPVSKQNKEDWEFQENILLSQQLALTRSSDMMEWVTLMICKATLPSTFKMQTTVSIGKGAKGIGFLFNIEGPQERKGLIDESLCLWLGSTLEPGCFLSRSHAQILTAPDVFLSHEKKHQIRIEKEESHLRLFIDGAAVLDYLCHLPMSGPHFGVMLKDGDTHISPIDIFIRSPSVMMSCLAIPDNFLMAKHYTKAFLEYKKISTSFPGRKEQYEATFRAGITLVEQAHHARRKKEKEHFLQGALQEFSLLRKTAVAPMEFLGKSLVYREMGDVEEEVKCLDIALRKYGKHPKRHLLEEELLYRLHEAAYVDRQGAYHFFLLCLRHLPEVFSKPYHKVLLTSLQKHWHPLPLLEKIDGPSAEEQTTSFCIHISFWLANPYALVEILEKRPHPILAANALFCLMVLGFEVFAEECMYTLKENESRLYPLATLLQIKKKKVPLEHGISSFLRKEDIGSKRVLFHLIDEHRSLQREDILRPLAERDPLFLPLLLTALVQSDPSAFLTMLSAAEKHLSKKWHSYFLGCKVALEQGKQKGILFLMEHPSFFSFNRFFIEKEGMLSRGDLSSLFYWERIELLKQASFFCLCCGDEKTAQSLQQMLGKERKKLKNR